jgi:hypothetical protein
MNDLMRDKLQTIANDELLVKSLMALFHIEIEKLKPSVDDADNELIGQKYRSFVEAREIVENTLDSLRNYQTESNNKIIPNRGE